jgi:hypothetical protein
LIHALHTFFILWKYYHFLEGNSTISRDLEKKEIKELKTLIF